MIEGHFHDVAKRQVAVFQHVTKHIGQWDPAAHRPDGTPSARTPGFHTCAVICSVALPLRHTESIQRDLRGVNMKKYLATVLTLLMLAVTGFAQTDNHAKAKKGAVIGGVAGAIAGAVIDNNSGHHSAKRGAVIGGVAVTAVGAVVGAMMDKQERDLRQIQGGDVTP